MDRNSMIGLGLIFAILVTFAWINQPSEGELKALKLQKDSIVNVQLQKDSAVRAQLALNTAKDSIQVIDSAAIQQSYGTFGSAALGKEEFTTLQNEELLLTFSNKGGALKKVILKKQKKYDGTELILFDGTNEELNYSFKTNNGKQINTSDLYFTPQLAADGKSLSMVINVGPNQYIEQRYSLTETDNLLDYQFNMVGLDKQVAAGTNFIDMSWVAKIRQQEKTFDAEHRTTTVYYKTSAEEPDYISETKAEAVDLTSPVKWISFKQQYFNASLIADKEFASAKVETKDDETKQYIKQLSANLIVPYNHTANESFGMKFYFGPNHFKTLEKLDMHQLERIVPMGWGIFRWVNKYLTVNVFYFLSQYITSFGLIIFLLTLIIKTVLFPLVYKSYLSTAKMRVLKPELDEIKAKFGDDMTKIQQENMKMYRQAGVNPLGGCIPVLLQMPVLVAMFQFFPSAFELRQQAFLWAPDLSTYDSIFDFAFHIPGYGSHVSLFALLMTISSVVYAVYNNEQSGMTGQMKWMSYFMPVIFLFMLNSFAAGLNYYYFVSNIFTIGQQLIIRSFVDDSKMHAQIQENKKKPVTKSKFQQKLEEMASARGADAQKPIKKK
ncbi:MAG: membrane protein insertase YidC [Bacteroidia bacterium]|nr:membrane protein insertase YidC [Bacteroidia bacterium]MBP9689655.1 membrane protein insertase YidC [Bacteroidia bacterium]